MNIVSFPAFLRFLSMQFSYAQRHLCFLLSFDLPVTEVTLSCVYKSAIQVIFVGSSLPCCFFFFSLLAHLALFQAVKGRSVNGIVWCAV